MTKVMSRLYAAQHQEGLMGVEAITEGAGEEGGAAVPHHIVVVTLILLYSNKT